MIGIRLIDQSYLTLKEQASLSLQLNNPLFTNDANPGDFVFPFDIDNDGLNAGIIYSLRKNDLDARLEYERVAVSDARIKLLEWTKEKATINILAGLSAFDFWDKPLKEIDLGTVNMGTTTADVINYLATAAFHDTDVNSPVTFPPYVAPNYYGDLNPDFCGVVNAYDRMNSVHNENVLQYAPLNKYSYSPAIFVKYIITKIFQLAGYEIGGNIYGSIFNRAIVHSNVSLDLSVDHTTIAICPIAIIKHIPGVQYPRIPFSQIQTDPDNKFNTTLYEYSMYGDDDFEVTLEMDFEIITNDTFPGLKFQVEYENVGAWQLTAGGFSGALPIGQRIVVKRTFSFRSGTAPVGSKIYVRFFGYTVTPGPAECEIAIYEAKITIKPIKWNSHNILQKSFAIKDHVPDVTCGEFISAFIKAVALDVTVDAPNKIVYFNYVKLIETGSDAPELDLTGTAIQAPLENLEAVDPVKEALFDIPSNDQALSNLPLKPIPPDTVNFDSELRFDEPCRTGQFAFAMDVNTVFESYDDSGLKWRPYTYCLQPYKVSEKGEDYKVSVCPLMMTRFDMDTHGKCLLPVMGVQCVSSIYKGADRMKEIRISFPFGSVQSEVNYYPLATTSILNDQLTYLNNSIRWSPEVVFAIYHLFFFKRIYNGATAKQKFIIDTLHLSKIYKSNQFYFDGILAYAKVWDVTLEDAKPEGIEIEVEYININPIDF